MAEAKKNVKVLVRTNDGAEQETVIESYDAKAIADLINKPSSGVVAIGDIVVQASFVNGVRPVKE